MIRKTGITRQQYKELKKKDHQQMNDFLLRFWQDGYREGLAAGKKSDVTLKDMEKAIRSIKGMGETRVNAVMQQVYRLYEGDKQ